MIKKNQEKSKMCTLLFLAASVSTMSQMACASQKGDQDHQTSMNTTSAQTNQAKNLPSNQQQMEMKKASPSQHEEEKKTANAHHNQHRPNSIFVKNTSQLTSQSQIGKYSNDAKQSDIKNPFNIARDIGFLNHEMNSLYQQLDKQIQDLYKKTQQITEKISPIDAWIFELYYMRFQSDIKHIKETIKNKLNKIDPTLSMYQTSNANDKQDEYAKNHDMQQFSKTGHTSESPLSCFLKENHQREEKTKNLMNTIWDIFKSTTIVLDHKSVLTPPKSDPISPNSKEIIEKFFLDVNIIIKNLMKTKGSPLTEKVKYMLNAIKTPVFQALEGILQDFHKTITQITNAEDTNHVPILDKKAIDDHITTIENTIHKALSTIDTSLYIDYDYITQDNGKKIKNYYIGQKTNGKFSTLFENFNPLSELYRTIEVYREKIQNTNIPESFVFPQAHYAIPEPERSASDFTYAFEHYIFREIKKDIDYLIAKSIKKTDILNKIKENKETFLLLLSGQDKKETIFINDLCNNSLDFCKTEASNTKQTIVDGIFSEEFFDSSHNEEIRFNQDFFDSNKFGGIIFFRNNSPVYMTSEPLEEVDRALEEYTSLIRDVKESYTYRR